MGTQTSILEGRRRPAAPRAYRAALAVLGTMAAACGLGWLHGAAAASGLEPLPVPPPDIRREPVPGPLEWTPGVPREFLIEPHHAWVLTPETAVIANAVGTGLQRPITQIRMRIEETTPEGLRPIGIVQHVANTEIAVFAPDDPRPNEPPAVFEDPDRPWPNPVLLGFYDTVNAVDLNGNDRNEVVLTAMASISDPAARRLVLLEPDDDGRPRIVEPRELVSVVRFDEAVLTGIRFEPRRREPSLTAEWLPLHGCRFLAQLGIPNRPPSNDYSCRIPLVLKADANGRFRPIYDRQEHAGLLDRLKSDLSEVITADTASVLSPSAQAALARAAAFFYLTGAETEARLQLGKALGSHANDYAVRMLLNRMERYFLDDAPDDSRDDSRDNSR